MKVTIELPPDVTPELLDLAADYLGKASAADFCRDAVLDVLTVVRDDAIPSPDGRECIGSRSDIERELFGEWESYLPPEPGDEWKGDPGRE